MGEAAGLPWVSALCTGLRGLGHRQGTSPARHGPEPQSRACPPADPALAVRECALNCQLLRLGFQPLFVLLLILGCWRCMEDPCGRWPKGRPSVPVPPSTTGVLPSSAAGWPDLFEPQFPHWQVWALEGPLSRVILPRILPWSSPAGVMIARWGQGVGHRLRMRQVSEN